MEAELRRLSRWQEQPPSAESLTSSQPFYVDTLSFDQWLQFVFIARLKVMIETQAPLPAHSEILPMAQTVYSEADSGRLIGLLGVFDKLINEQEFAAVPLASGPLTTKLNL